MNKPRLIFLRILARLTDLGILYFGFDLFYDWMNRDNPMAYDRLFNGVIEMSYYLPFCMLYVPLSEWLTQGFTLGKFICRIRVRRADGSLPGLREAFLRWTGSLVDFTLTAGLGALISAFFSEKMQRLGDRLARTVVAGA